MGQITVWLWRITCYTVRNHALKAYFDKNTVSLLFYHFHTVTLKTLPVKVNNWLGDTEHIYGVCIVFFHQHRKFRVACLNYTEIYGAIAKELISHRKRLRNNKEHAYGITRYKNPLTTGMTDSIF